MRTGTMQSCLILPQDHELGMEDLERIQFFEIDKVMVYKTIRSKRCADLRG